MPHLRGLLPNLLLSLVASVVFLGSLEGICRLLERSRRGSEVADYIWDWERMWDDDFYTVGSGSVGWPPWEEFNGDGLRDRAHPIEKLEGSVRVACLGDSVTMGDQIERRVAYPQVLEELLQSEGPWIEVLNAALWGWSTRQERIAYERIVRRYHPDEVLLGVCLNDIPELQNNLSRPSRYVAALHERSALVRWIVNAEGREIRSVEELFTRRDSKKVREGFGRFFDEVRRLRKEVEADGAKLSVLVFPFRFQVTAGAPAPSVQDRILAFCSAEGIRCLDLLPRLREIGEAAFVDYDHLSSTGTRAVAEEIRRRGWLPSTPALPTLLAGCLALTTCLGDPDPQVRRAAAWAVGRAPAAKVALTDVEARLKDDPSPSVREAAARTLGARSREAATPALFAALDDRSEPVRWAAADALWRLGVRPLPQLVQALQSRDLYVRGFAAWSLGEMGEAAKDAVPALIEALREEDRFGRGAAAQALGKIGPAAREAVPVLVHALKSPHGYRRVGAVRALGRLGPVSVTAVPALVEALGDENDHLRFYAARALGRIGPEAQEAVPPLERALKDPEPRVAREATKALRLIRGH